jgi:hypothetical protein
MTIEIKKGSTEKSIRLRIFDADGNPDQGVTAATSGLVLWYQRTRSAKVTITPVDLSALTDVHTDGGLLHVDSGWYRLDVPDAAFAAGGTVDDVLIGGEATAQTILSREYTLVNYTRDDQIEAAGISAWRETAQAVSPTTVTLAAGTNVTSGHMFWAYSAASGANYFGRVKSMNVTNPAAKVATLDPPPPTALELPLVYTSWRAPLTPESRPEVTMTHIGATQQTEINLATAIQAIQELALAASEASANAETAAALAQTAAEAASALQQDIDGQPLLAVFKLLAAYAAGTVDVIDNPDGTKRFNFRSLNNTQTRISAITRGEDGIRESVILTP